MLDMLTPYGKKELCHLMGIGYAGFLKDNCDLKITCPVLLIIGENDKTGYLLVVIPGAAHNANVDQAEEVNKVIESFITLG